MSFASTLTRQGSWDASNGYGSIDLVGGLGHRVGQVQAAGERSGVARSLLPSSGSNAGPAAVVIAGCDRQTVDAVFRQAATAIATSSPCI